MAWNRHACLGLIALWIGGACHDEPAPPSVPVRRDAGAARTATKLEDAAGEVIDVKGRVVAYRVQADRGRVLRRGDPVYEDDEITTTGDALVEIELYQNHAHLVLSLAKKRRLADTAAWSAAAGATRAFVDQNNAPL